MSYPVSMKTLTGRPTEARSARAWRALIKPAFWGILLLPVFAGAGIAQEKYAPWSDPTAQKKTESKLRNLIDELNKLVDGGEKARAADPRFLRDLRNLARRYDRPWRVMVLSDNFSDGDFTKNPTWTVTEGKFWIERGFGLRGMAQQTSQPAEEGRQRRGDVAGQIVGALLNRALGGGSQGSGTRSAPVPVSTRAAVHVAKRITNAFAMTLDLFFGAKKGTLEIGTYQGKDRKSGYRLRYHTGGSPGLELLRVSARGSSLIETYSQRLALEDKKFHRLEWTRDPFGAMVVKVDGKVLLQASDRGFRDPFNGFVLANHDGDYILRRIAIEGTG